MTVPAQNLDLAVIGNSHVAALLDRQAQIVWWCYPQLDGDPVFSRLLAGDEEKGFLGIELEGQAQSQSNYRHNSAIVETILTARDGSSIRVTDFCPRFNRPDGMFRPPMIVRRIEPLRGQPRIRVRMRPCFDYGAAKPDHLRGATYITYRSSSAAVRLTTDGPLDPIIGETYFPLTSPIHLMVGADEALPGDIALLCQDYLSQTQFYWQEWVQRLAAPMEWQDAVIRAAITLQLCTFEESGGTVAALTTSVPEAPDSGRNWDYRYNWLRDGYFTVRALTRLGVTSVVDHYRRYLSGVLDIEQAGNLTPLHALNPHRSLPEYQVLGLSGYRGMGPVRVGNAATAQTQNDGFGNIILALAPLFLNKQSPDPNDEPLFSQLEALGTRAVTAALTPDAGLWEFRTRAQIHTYSAAMCWAACDRLAAIADALGKPDRRDFWRQQAANLREEILSRSWNPLRNSFVATFGGDDIDASLLQLADLGIVEATDPRFLGTIAAVEQDLGFFGHLKRYKNPDDFGEPEVAFIICRFWYIDALVMSGQQEKARTLFDDMLKGRNSFGLYPEDIDPITGELWGNFPQTYSHAGLITSALRLSHA